MLDFFLALLSPRPVRLVVLAPGIDVCSHRNVTRRPEDFFDFDDYERREADMQREFGHNGWWFDTASLGPEETADRIVAEITERCSPLEAGWHEWLRKLHGG